MLNKKKYFLYFRLSIYSAIILFLIIGGITIYFFNRNTKKAVHDYLANMNITISDFYDGYIMDSHFIFCSFKIGDKGANIKIQNFPLGIGFEDHESFTNNQRCEFLLTPGFGRKAVEGIKLGDNSCAFKPSPWEVKEGDEAIKIYFVRDKTTVVFVLQGPKGDKDILESDEYKEVLKLLEYIDGIL